VFLKCALPVLGFFFFFFFFEILKMFIYHFPIEKVRPFAV